MPSSYERSQFRFFPRRCWSKDLNPGLPSSSRLEMLGAGQRLRTAWVVWVRCWCSVPCSSRRLCGERSQTCHLLWI